MVISSFLGRKGIYMLMLFEKVEKVLVGERLCPVFRGERCNNGSLVRRVILHCLGLFLVTNQSAESSLSTYGDLWSLLTSGHSLVCSPSKVKDGNNGPFSRYLLSYIYSHH
jgi:hypothetical protein